MTDAPVTSIVVGDAARRRLEEKASYVDGHSTMLHTSATWLVAAARHLPGEPVVVTIDRDGRTVALAALSVSSARGVRRIELLGGDMNDYATFYYDDEDAADLLAAAVASWVRDQRRWSLALTQLAPDDAVMAALAARLDGRVEEGPPMPQIHGLGTTYRASRNRRSSGSKARNRLEADHRVWELLVVDDRAGVERWLPEVVHVRRERDHALGRRSHLDDPAHRAFYEAVVTEAVASGRAVIDLLVIEEQVGGFTLSLHDGPVRRLMDGRVAHAFERYRGGMLCDLTAVKRAQDDPSVTDWDWLRGRTESKFGNAEIHRYELHATSHRWISTVDQWEHAARERVKSALPKAALQRIAAR